MPRRVLVQGTAGTFDLVEVPAINEHQLQEIMKANPQLIPAEDMGIDGDLLVVGRETTLASGAIDLVCLAKSGDLVLVEFKTGPQNPDFRHALAQLIDYGSDLWGMTFSDFDHGVVQRYLASKHCDPAFKTAADLHDAVDHTNWDLDEAGWHALSVRLAEVLATGDFHFVVAAQRFTTAMQTSLEYLNATTRFGRHHLMQVVCLEGGTWSAFSAQVVAAPSKTSKLSQQGSAGQTNEADFLTRIEDEGYREALTDVLTSARALGLVLAWYTKGASIRLRTSDRKEPLSIGWVFLEGAQWYGARHLSLGVDLDSLKQMPSVASAVTEYTKAVGAITDAKAITSKLDAFMFEPLDVASNKVAIVECLEHLVAAAAKNQ